MLMLLETLKTPDDHDAGDDNKQNKISKERSFQGPNADAKVEVDARVRTSSQSLGEAVKRRFVIRLLVKRR